MISREEFKERCKKLIPQEELEKIEKDKKMQNNITKIVITVEVVFSLIVAFSTSFFALSTLPVSIIFSILIINVVFTSKRDNLKEKYASDIIKILMEGFEYSFQGEEFLDKKIYCESGFGSKRFDDYKGEDLLIVDIPKNDGTPSGVKLNICDLRVTEEDEKRNSDGSTSSTTDTVYKGVLGYVKFPFKFKCNLNINNHDWDMEKIVLEDINFNKKFKVYTDNQLEALVILTPTMMNKLMAFSQRVNGFKISIKKEGKMYLGMSRNLFELVVSSKVSFDALFGRFYDDISNILAIVNEIKDNDKVFKM